MDKTNTADLSSDVFAVMEKILNSLPFHRIHQKLANSDITKEALNCIASLWQVRALLIPLVSSRVLFCDPKTSSAQVWLWPDLK